jgi:hypothetical protein
LRWAFPARSIMVPGIIPATTMGRDIMLLDTIGDLTGMRTTGVPIGGTGTGGITAGTGIEKLGRNPRRNWAGSPENLPSKRSGSNCKLFRKVNQTGRDNIPGLLGDQIGGLLRSMFCWAKDERRAQA